MAIDILQNCYFDTEKIQSLWIGSRLINEDSITFPLEYRTINGSDDSIIAIEDWDYVNDVITIGGQQIVINKILNSGDNISFSEQQVINQNGKTYLKTLSFIIPQMNVFLINQLKQLTITSSGLSQLSGTIALLIDENDQTLIIGYDKALYVANSDINIDNDNNAVALTYTSSSYSRSRSFEILQ